VTPSEPANAIRTLRIVHLFPDLLSTYGDGGNIRTLLVRAERRAIRVTVTHVLADRARLPDGDLFVIGGGQDRDQLRVESALRRLGPELERYLDSGASLLAVCAGYQNLGRRHRFADGRTMHGPGIFPAETIAEPGRLVGPVIARLGTRLITWTGMAPGARATIVGFENHSGRTYLEDTGIPLATVQAGAGNNGEDGTEGSVMVGAGSGRRGVWIGTYLHGPLLPRNPHVADVLIAAGLARSGQRSDLVPLDDGDEWCAHDRFVQRTLHRTWLDRLAPGLGRAIEPVRTAIGR
jgi:CobQ-like glutamine amidotransferase family enzyme